MYHLQLTALKRDLITHGLGENKSAAYLIATFALMSVGTNSDRVEPLTACLFTLVMILGMYYCYQKNGASKGSEFLNRFISLNWVVGWRVLIPGFTFLFTLYFYGIRTFLWDKETGALIIGLLSIPLQILLYARIGHHLEDIAKKK